VTGATSVEDDEGRGQVLLFVRRVRPRVVELVEDVGGDPPRAPLAVDRLARPGRLDGHVVRMDLGADAVEQDSPLAADRRARGRPAAPATPADPPRARPDDRAA